MKTIEITLIKSFVGHKPNQVATAKALGLTKVNQTVEKEANEAILGMVNTIKHLVKVTEK